jgi:hypothetical protein
MFYLFHYLIISLYPFKLYFLMGRSEVGEACLGMVQGSVARSLLGSEEADAGGSAAELCDFLASRKQASDALGQQVAELSAREAALMKQVG